MSELIPGCQAQIIAETPPFSFNGKPLITGRERKPMKLFIYGRNGIGKTTFAAGLERPVLLDLEGNADHLTIDRQALVSYKEVQSFLYELKTQPHSFKTVILDSVDILQDLIIEGILVRHHVKTLKDVGGYGAGYSELTAEFANVMKRMDSLFRQGMNIVFLGHETISRIEDPEEAAYDRTTPAIRENNYAPLCNWCHAVLFATNKITRAAAEDKGFGQKRATRVLRDNSRIFYTIPSPAYVAKNVFELPNPLPLDCDIFLEKIDNFYNQPQEKKEN